MQCPACGRHKFTLREETDPKTQKIWLIRRCVVCLHPVDILPYGLRVLPEDERDEE